MNELGRSKKKRAIRLIAILLIIVGIGIVSYPYIAQKLYEVRATFVIGKFNDEKSKFNEMLESLFQRMEAYNKNLFATGQKNLVDPFSYEKASIDLIEYGLVDNIVGYIEIPKMGVSLPIYLGATQDNMVLGAVHLSETSLPIGGENTNCVIAAHRGMRTAAMFRDIEELVSGDEVTVTNFKEALHYRVKEIKIIDPNDVDKVHIQKGKDMVTLLSCHPYLVNNQRYVVFCERVQG